MRAVTYDAFRGPLRVVELPPPSAPPGGAVVAVARTGLCRSDWHGWMGHDDDITALPHVPGHEFAGTVVAVGDGVDAAWLGRPVTAPFVQACGACPICADGDGQVCPHQEQPGFSRPGSFAELVVVRAAATNLVRLPEGVDPALAAALGCRVATAYRAVVDHARPDAGQWVAVIGCGGVGLAAVAIAASRGARVVAVDPSAAALAAAGRLGAEVLVPAEGAVGPVVEATGGGAHAALDCFGSAATCRDALLMLRRRGRAVQVGLLPGPPPPVPVARMIAWELALLGSHGMAAAGYPRLLDDLASGRLDLAGLIAPGGPLSLTEVTTALPAMGTQAAGGVRVIDPAR